MIFETPLIRFDDALHCRVQVRRCLDGSVQQRHVWYRVQGEDLDPPSYDRWIAAATRNFDSAIRGKTPAPHERDEAGELIAALREIAAGHNDPRARAAEALRRAGIDDTETDQAAAHGWLAAS